MKEPQRLVVGVLRRRAIGKAPLERHGESEAGLVALWLETQHLEVPFPRRFGVSKAEGARCGPARPARCARRALIRIDQGIVTLGSRGGEGPRL